MLPMIKIGDDRDIMNYLIEYKDWSYEIVRVDKENYRERALLQGQKSINDELNALSYEYEGAIREIEKISDFKKGEYILTKKYNAYNEDGKKIGVREVNIAVNPTILLESRIKLYDIVGRLVSSSPHFGNCWTQRFKVWDLHTSLFIEADEIMCSTFCPRERRVSKIYYLTHFVNSNAPIKNAFKIDKEFDNELHDDIVATEINNPEFWTVEDYYKLWIIDNFELCILSLIERGHKEKYISTCLWISDKRLKEKLEDIQEKLKCFIL